MLERIFGKPKEQALAPDVKPNHIVPDHLLRELIALKEDDRYSEGKTKIVAFLKTLNRPDLLAFDDADQFKDQPLISEDAAWEAYHDAVWERDWPLGKESYTERIPQIVKETMRGYDDLKKQVEGIQKKLDRLSKLVENTEVTMSGATALKL